MKAAEGQLGTQFLMEPLYLRSVSRIIIDIKAAVMDSSWEMPARTSKQTATQAALAGICREVDGPYPVLRNLQPLQQLLPLPWDFLPRFGHIHGPSHAGFAKHDAITRSRGCNRSNATVSSSASHFLLHDPSCKPGLFKTVRESLSAWARYWKRE